MQNIKQWHFGDTDTCTVKIESLHARSSILSISLVSLASVLGAFSVDLSHQFDSFRNTGEARIYVSSFSCF